MDENTRKRCLSIVGDIKDKLFTIQSELTRDYQSPKYLLEKIKPIVWDSNVLNGVFEDEQKLENLRNNGDDDNV